MKMAISTLLITLAMLFISACKQPREVIRYVPIRTDSIVTEKLVPVQIPADSASLTALFECDSLNRVIMTNVEQFKGRNLQLLTNFDKLKGALQILANQPPDTVYLPSKIIYIKEQIPVEVQRDVYINQLNWWQKALAWVGGITLFISTLTIIFKIKNFKF